MFLILRSDCARHLHAGHELPSTNIACLAEGTPAQFICAAVTVGIYSTCPKHNGFDHMFC